MQTYLYKFLLIGFLILPTLAIAGESVEQFRYLSMIIRDQLPTVEESKDFYNKEKSLSEFTASWLASDAHTNRVKRYFDDMFGLQKYMFVSGENLDLIKSNHYVEISWDARWIDFVDDSGVKSVALATNEELASGSVKIQEPSQMVSLLNDKLNDAAGAGVNIIASYDSGAEKISIAATGTSVFEIHFASGANTDNSLATALGYTKTDKIGSLSYQAESVYEESLSNNIPTDLRDSRELDVYYIPSFEQDSCFDEDTSSPILMDVWWSNTPEKICPTAVSPDGFNTAFFRISSEDAKLDFIDQDGSYSTSIPLKSYKTADELAAAIETAMEAASISRDYSVSYDSATAKFSVAVDSGNVQLAFGSSTDSIGNIVGISDTSSNSSHTGYQVRENHRCSTSGELGFAHPDCGCGDKAFMCYPQELKGLVMSAIGNEFQTRAAHFYDSDGTWLDVFGGSKFVGNRFLYHHYLYQQELLLTSKQPDADAMTDLMAMKLDQEDEVPMPEYSSVRTGPDGVQRSGVVTSPGFLRRFNNFRSRTRAVVERLLCKDVDSSLNIDGTSTFYNPNFADGTAQPEGQAVNDHGHKESCSTCHYSLDNFGSTLIMWADGGEGSFGEWAWWQKSQMGHVLGQTGSGPRFLMQTMIENQQSGFYECMAKSAFEDFTGADWSGLDQAAKSSFISAARVGPKETIGKILKSKTVLDLRSHDQVIESQTVAIAYDFNTDINPIVSNKCGGSACHSSASSLIQLEDNKNNFDGINKIRIENTSMPPPGSPALTADEKQILLQYLNAL